MKTSSGDAPQPPPLLRSKAWSYLVTNLLVLPGLGSVMAGYKSGYVQIFLAVAGFIITLVAIVSIALVWSREFQLPDDQRLYLAAMIGVVVFLASWCWSLVTSLAIFRRSK